MQVECRHKNSCHSHKNVIAFQIPGIETKSGVRDKQRGKLPGSILNPHICCLVTLFDVNTLAAGKNCER